MAVEEAIEKLKDFPYYTVYEYQEIAIKTLIKFAQKELDKKK